MIVAGVDPGAEGAVVLFDTDAWELSVYDMPTYVEQGRKGKRTRVDPVALARTMMLDALPVDVACIEKVGAMPGQGVSSMFAFGRAAGIVEGVLACVSDEQMTLRPQQWQPIARVRGGEQVKANARARAAELFPRQAHLFKRVKDSGRADAALIAYAAAKTKGAIE